MSAASSSDFARLMGPVALKVLGEPNQSLCSKTELRWGTRGSFCVDLTKGTWCDHSDGDRGGGVLDFVMVKQQVEKADALSATGYLPRAEFEAMADLFFAKPEQSVHGWERAVDAQRRIVAAVDHVLAATVHVGGDVAIVAHGGVGTLLLCHLRRDPISRKYDQPPSNGGNYFAFEIGSRELRHSWRPINE